MQPKANRHPLIINIRLLIIIEVQFSVCLIQFQQLILDDGHALLVAGSFEVVEANDSKVF